MLWVPGTTTRGFSPGETAAVKNNIETAATVIVRVSVLPIAVKLLRHRKPAKAAIAAATHSVD